MNDRELLELAATAAGYDVEFMQPSSENIVSGERCGFWRPLEDDGDALRLAVKLRMTVTVDQNGYTVCEACIFDKGIFIAETEYHKETDDQAATRRAIVRAAAAIGKAMP